MPTKVVKAENRPDDTMKGPNKSREVILERIDRGTKVARSPGVGCSHHPGSEPWRG